MHKGLASLLVLCLAGCGEPGGSCSITQNVRVVVQGRTFTIPADLKPFVLGAPKGSRLPSNKDREAGAGGAWAYCQRPEEPPTIAETIGFFPRHPGMAEIVFLIIGRESSLLRPETPGYPRHAESGFEVMRTKGSTSVFSPAGGVRPTPVLADCAHDDGGALKSCRISFVTQNGADVTFDLEGDHPLSSWPDLIANVDAYVAGFEAPRVRINRVAGTIEMAGRSNSRSPARVDPLPRLSASLMSDG